MEVSEEQKSFVADNDISIIEAYTAITGKGYGKEAVKLALEFIKTYPCGDADYCWLSYEPENQVAAKLYHSFGFEETGDKGGEELIDIIKLGKGEEHL